ncbi:HDOD domain-containing protein [Parasulfuritortus cantonensis]|uniref:HDOD domain-containing protein n=1 Tax=Parasulfuritortus cantonensis TaxID=2528202 RepID=A0A4V2NWA0_9PROT|nr:HDOD domain-containing protein [Parasulfuritortus cantonensis]TCJ16512.1 HDOD domain-containing protein [Parasulfuritortus cantonensis]
MEKAKEMVVGIKELSSLPAVYHQVRGVLDNADSSIIDLANVVSVDAAITARLLHVVNSVYFGLMSRVDTVSRAVSILGMQQVHDIVLATSVSAMFKGMSPANMNMTRFWSNSVMRALIARTGAEMVRAGELERFFVAGLLSDLGHLVMYEVEPKLAEQAQMLSVQSGRPLHELERELLGCDYAEVGAALVDKWHLPPRLGAAIAGQIEPALADELYRRDAAMLNLARIMTDAMEQKMESEAIAELFDESIWTLSGLKPANVATIRLIAEMNHGEVVTLFFPQLRPAG